MTTKILFQNNYPTWVKLSIDFFLLVLIFYCFNSLVGLPGYFMDSHSHLMYGLVSIVLLYFFRVYKTMFRYFNLQDIIRLLLALFLSSLILMIISFYSDRFSIINQSLFFFISQFFIVL